MIGRLLRHHRTPDTTGGGALIALPICYLFAVRLVAFSVNVVNSAVAGNRTFGFRIVSAENLATIRWTDNVAQAAGDTRLNTWSAGSMLSYNAGSHIVHALPLEFIVLPGWQIIWSGVAAADAGDTYSDINWIVEDLL